jgi:phosphoribosylformylglycinamidine (FGAM) synthase-like enzyme
VFDQLGDETPDLDEPAKLLALYEVTQAMVETGSLLAGHDRSDGGLATVRLVVYFIPKASWKLIGRSLTLRCHELRCSWRWPSRATAASTWR